jgi:hypothetical protein
MTAIDLKDLAKRGALARLAELKDEEAAILRAFPELRRGARHNTNDGTTVLPSARKRRRRRMSAAQRRAVSVRMKKFWAARRKARQ